jgi:arabinogalactan endo-1,4-beta-galactosidase
MQLKLLQSLWVHRFKTVVSAFLLASCSGYADSFSKGADVSWLPQMEATGYVFRDREGNPADCLKILKDHGMNMVRLRIWHTPDNGRDGLAATLQMAKRIKALDLGFMLDFHYSDYWADPGKQYKPAAWENLNFTALRDSVRTYSANVIQALVDQGTTPDIVQIGNETTTGMLWDEGRVGGSFDTTSQWGRYTALTKAGIEGVREAGGNDIQIMIHIDRGGDANGVRWFFDNFTGFHIFDFHQEKGFIDMHAAGLIGALK